MFKNEPYVNVERGNTGLELCLANQTAMERLNGNTSSPEYTWVSLLFAFSSCVSQMFHHPERMPDKKQHKRRKDREAHCVGILIQSVCSIVVGGR